MISHDALSLLNNPENEGTTVKKVAIITFHNAVNYGAILQCYALQSFVEQNCKCAADVLDYQPMYFRKAFFDPMKPWTAIGIKSKGKALVKCILLNREMRSLSRKHRELLRYMGEKLHLVPMRQETERQYDGYIAGSDQVWNLELIENDTTYLLDFVKEGKKISYAASFKVSDVDGFAKKAYQKYLPSFDSISVRESNLQAYLRDEYSFKAECVLDPTLLVGSEFWKNELCDTPVVSEKYLLLYYVNMPRYLVDHAFAFAKERNLKVVSLNRLRGRKDYLDYSGASVEEFLNLIANAETVFTTSFHGMAFSILFQREFYYEVPDNSYNNNARLEDLAEKLGLQAQNLQKSNNDGVDWDAVCGKLKDLQRKSSDFLKEAIYTGKA